MKAMLAPVTTPFCQYGPPRTAPTREFDLDPSLVRQFLEKQIATANAAFEYVEAIQHAKSHDEKKTVHSELQKKFSGQSMAEFRYQWHFASQLSANLGNWS